MAPALARFVLAGAAVAILVASFSESRIAIWLGAFAVALFPAALMLLAQPRCERIEPWIVLLALSLAGGMVVTLAWPDSPIVAGLPTATWLAWLLLAVVPFVLVVFGIATREPGP